MQYFNSLSIPPFGGLFYFKNCSLYLLLYRRSQKVCGSCYSYYWF